MRLSDTEYKIIGPTIRAVVASESKRYFSSEHNTIEYSAVVFEAIRTAIRVALHRAGISFDKIVYDIDCHDVILDQMCADGYQIADATEHGNC